MTYDHMRMRVAKQNDAKGMCLGCETNEETPDLVSKHVGLGCNKIPMGILRIENLMNL